MPTAWLVRAHVTGEDAWSLEYAGIGRKTFHFAMEVNLHQRLEDSGLIDDAALITKCFKAGELFEHESRNLTIRKLHL